MSEDEEIVFLLSLAVKYGSTGWKDSNCPIVTATTKVVRAALKTAKKSVEWKGITHCELALQAQARYRRKDRASGSHPAQPVGIAVWLNQERWTLMCEPEEAKEVRASNKCQCGQDVHGPRYTECTYHLNFKDGRMVGGEELRQYYKGHPEIKTFNKQQSIQFIKQKLSLVAKRSEHNESNS